MLEDINARLLKGLAIIFPTQLCERWRHVGA